MTTTGGRQSQIFFVYFLLLKYLIGMTKKVSNNLIVLMKFDVKKRCSKKIQIYLFEA